MKFKFILVLLFFMFFVNYSFAKEEQGEEEETARNYYYIHELNQKGFNFGTFETLGYVANAYECPPCPPKAFCKPCMGNHIVVSEDNRSIDDYLLTDREIIVFVDHPLEFKKDVQYKFLIKILDVKTVDQQLNNIKLIFYQKIE